MLLRYVFRTLRSVTGRLNWSWHYLVEVDISVLSPVWWNAEVSSLWKKWFLWEKDWNRKQRRFCWQQHGSTGPILSCLPPWVIEIYRAGLQCELSQASQIWQMAWQVTNTAGNLLACWAEANTFETSLSSLKLNGVKKDVYKSPDPDCWWRTVTKFSNNAVTHPNMATIPLFICSPQLPVHHRQHPAPWLPSAQLR